MGRNQPEGIDMATGSITANTPNTTKNTRPITALALLSGGLDSTLAVKLILEQGIDVIAVKFTSPFCNCDQKGRCHAKETAEKFDVPFLSINKGIEYLNLVRNPKYGHGSGINPCIDCRIFMLKKTKEIAREIGARFIVTGEVLDQRPMSQYKRALKIIEMGAGLEGKILRPLSAKHLPTTDPEREGWVDREKLLGIQGRSRKNQIALAKDMGIDDYACAAGGCLLTEKAFANKLRDLFKHKDEITWNDIYLLKVGRHFRLNSNKIIVGRNEAENRILIARKLDDDYIFEVPGVGSPYTILEGPKSIEAIEFAARITAKYSDCTDKQILVKYGENSTVKTITIEPMTQEEADRYNLAIA